MADILRNRQHGFLADQRLAQDIGEEAGSRLVGLAGADADRRQADADAIEEAAAAVVGEQQLADRFLGAVARKRSKMIIVRDGEGERRPTTAIDEVKTRRGL